MYFSATNLGFYAPLVHTPAAVNSMPDDAVELTDTEYRELLQAQSDGLEIYAGPDGRPLTRTPVVTTEQLVAGFTVEIQARLDTFAATRGYNSILSACSYATSTVPRFAAEGQYCVSLRDQTWSQCWAILDAVQAGQRPAPTLAGLLAELPTPTWPE